MIYITHDIDWLTPLHLYSIVKVFTHGNKWITLNQTFNRKLFTHQIEKLLVNQSQSVWLCGATNNHAYSKQGLRYSSKSNSLKSVITLLKQANAQIGLHSVSTQPIQEQANSLAELTQQPILFHRSHYLKFNAETLFKELKQCKILTDFSLGHARKISMPSQTNQTHHGVKTVPTILFDNAFFYNKPEQVFADFKQALNAAKTNNIDVAVLFHPENFAVNPALWDYYTETLKLIKQL